MVITYLKLYFGKSIAVLMCSVNVSACMKAHSSLYCPLWEYCELKVIHISCSYAHSHRVRTHTQTITHGCPGDYDYQWGYVTTHFLNSPAHREKGFLQPPHLSFLGLVLMSPRTVMSEKSIRNLLRRVAMLNGGKKTTNNNTSS